MRFGRSEKEEEKSDRVGKKKGKKKQMMRTRFLYLLVGSISRCPLFSGRVACLGGL